MHIGERADVILCADQEPGYYPIELHYDYACTMSPHGGPGGLPPFIPPGFHEVSSCRFYSFLHYTGQKEWFYGPPTSDKGTGGGKNPKPVAGVPFDLTRPADWKKTKMLNRPSWLKDKPDYSYTVTLGLNGPLYSKPTDIPLTKGRWYVVVGESHFFNCITHSLNRTQVHGCRRQKGELEPTLESSSSHERQVWC